MGENFQLLLNPGAHTLSFCFAVTHVVYVLSQLLLSSLRHISLLDDLVKQLSYLFVIYHHYILRAIAAGARVPDKKNLQR